MKRCIARHILIARLAALALFTFCLVQPPAGALATATAADSMPAPASDHRDGPIITNFNAGFVFGQTLRLTVAHTGGQAEEQNQPPPDVRAKVLLYDAQGRLIAQSAEARIPRNEFRFFDFNRAAINLPGEPGTGRLQVRARLVMNVAEPYHFTADPKASSLLLPSLEIIDNDTGRTRQTYNPYITVDFVETATGRTARHGNNFKQIGLAIHNHHDSGH